MSLDLFHWQRDLMRLLRYAHEGQEKAVCAAYARAERDGMVPRPAGDYSIPAERYARALWRDGVVRGWIDRV